MAAAAHVGHTGDSDPGQGEDRLGVAGAVGLQQGEGFHLLHSEDGDVVDLPVDVQGGDHFLSAGVFLDDFFHALTEGGDVLLPDGEARRQGVAAVAFQQVGALLQGAEEVEAAVGPAGALALAVFLEADHKHGAGELLTQAGGHDAHHPLVPVPVLQDQAVHMLFVSQPLGALGKDLQLHRLAFPVEFTQLMGQQISPAVVIGEKKVHSHGGLAHAPGGIDPGGQAVAHGGGVDGSVQGTRLHHERV